MGKFCAKLLIYTNWRAQEWYRSKKQYCLNVSAEQLFRGHPCHYLYLPFVSSILIDAPRTTPRFGYVSANRQCSISTTTIDEVEKGTLSNPDFREHD